MHTQVSSASTSATAPVETTGFLCLDGHLRALCELDQRAPGEFETLSHHEMSDVAAKRHTVYNFEVEKTHTYIAGGYRVHNTSALSFYDPDENGVLTAIYEDDEGRLVWESETPDGGKWVTVSESPANSDTTIVTKTYTLGLFDENGAPVLDEHGNPKSRFYLQQENVYEKVNGEDVLVDVAINENYWLYGDEVGGGIAAAATPFILQAIGAETPIERLAAGTLVDAIIQNIAEGGLNAIHHSLLYAPTNGEAVGFMITDAWSDFGIDLAISGIDTALSMASQIIIGEIFSGVEIDSIGDEIMVALVTEGLDNVLEYGVDVLIDTVLGADSALGQAYDPNLFNFASPMSYVGLALNVALNEVLPQPETVEGAFASAIAKVFAGSLGLGFIPGIIVTQVVGFLVGKIVDALFDKDPQAFANMSFNENTGRWGIDFVTSDDGGSKDLAIALADSVSAQIADFTNTMQSTDYTFTDGYTIRIGHYEEHLRNGDGKNYEMGESEVILASVVEAIRNLSATDGDLKVLRALRLDDLEADLVGLTTEQAYSMLVSRLKMAADYHYYLNNTEYVNQIILNAPDSALAKSWLATILIAQDTGLNDAFVYTGNETDNLILTSDGADTIDGGAGDDEIRTYGEDDVILGGAGDDLISGGAGADTIDGGAGVDVLTFDDSGVAAVMDLSAGAGLAGDAEGDTYVNIENIVGSDFGDSLTGDQLTNEIRGGLGSDSLFGHGGDDIIYGETGDDELFGDLAEDTSVSGDDILDGGVGDDVLHGGEGFDTFIGGAGHDRVSYTHSTRGVIASLATNQAKISGGIETFDGIEGLIGSVFRDDLTGDDGENSLEGGLGSDHLYGGRGSDTYVYALGDGNDFVSDYGRYGGIDKLLLVGINPGDVTFRSSGGEDLVITLPDGAQITVQDHFAESTDYTIEQIEFADGTVLGVEAIRARSLADQKAAGGDGVVLGSDLGETYQHSLGDGSYEISDWDNNARLDRLVFTDVTADEVSFRRGAGEDLVITLSNGERVTVAGHFLEAEDTSIEQIEFADGTILGMADIRNKSVADQKGDGGDGVVGGTHFAETYEHSLGDGSYEISDWDNNARVDRLVFTDVTADQVSFHRGTGEDLVITLSNGERVTVTGHFLEAEDTAIEEIAFADGTILGMADIRNKSVADQKGDGGDGTIVGTHFAETYEHSLGDGSYRISDWDNNARPDQLIFTDVNSDQVVLTDANGDLRIILPNGETVTIAGQLGTNDDYYIEAITFADGVTWAQPDTVANVTAFDAVPGYRMGTDADDIYTHAAGDGSYAIYDYDYSRGNDALVFTDLNAADVTLSRIGQDLVLTLSNGEVLTLVRQLDEDGRRSIETISFADGTTWDRAQMRDLLVAAQKATGAVVTGTDLDENYVHTAGDGSYAISDYDYSRGNDSLSFTDMDAADVTLSRSGSDLLLTLTNGEVITLVNQLDADGRRSIETISFADGTTWDRAQMRDLLVAEQKGQAAIVNGTDLDENYIHSAGDGSYAIYDYAYSRGNDSLTFTDMNATDVTLSRSSRDLLLTLANGEVITLVNQLDANGRFGVETISFADGTSLDKAQMHNRLVAEQKVDGGVIVGTELDEAYVHSAGDGSYTILDYNYSRGNDSLTFTDLTAAEVTLSRSGNNLILHFDNGEQITLADQMITSLRYGVESVAFADGVTWTNAEMRNQLVSDMKVGGVVVGTDLDETYIHNAGDGSYSIRDYNYSRGNDSLTFTSVTADQITLNRIGDDVVIAIDDGTTITLIDQLIDSRRHAIELFEFADGSTWSEVDFRNQVMHDMKVTGAVVGTENDETYSHSSGDGSYSVSDYNYNRGNDTFIFTDVNPDQVVVERLSSDPNDVVFTLQSGDQITLENQLNSDNRWGVEAIIFADGVEWTRADLSSAPVVDDEFVFV